jgi:signal peptidase
VPEQRFPADSSAVGAGVPLARARGVLSSLMLAGAFALAAMMLIPALLGYERYVVTGGSMTGSIDRGSIVFDKPVPVADLKVGDVITYKPPPDAHVSGLVTHRIVWVGRDAHGGRAFRTKGDANASPDSWHFTLHAPTQARVVAHVPLVGYALAALGSRNVRMLVIGLPALMIGIAVAVRLWRDPEDEAPEPAVATEGAVA